jgi:thioredoxin reductase (NADPH)
MQQNEIFDVVIIGAGPIGLACGIEAAKRKLKYLIIEKGCIVNSVFNYPTNMTFFSTSEKIELGGIPFVSHGIKPTRREALEYYRRVAQAYKLNMHQFEKVHLVEKDKTGFKVMTDKKTYLCRQLIVATGYYDNPNLLKIPGESLPKVRHYFDEAHPYAGMKTAVIGAGNSAVDVALELFRIGASVTMIIKEDMIKPSVKYWVKPDIENRISEGSIKAFFLSEVLEIRQSDIIISTPKGIVNIPNDLVFAMTGYHPDLNFLKESGIKIIKNSKAYFKKSSHETNVRGLYLAGVACSGSDTDNYFIENSIVHAEKIIEDIVRKKENLRTVN